MQVRRVVVAAVAVSLAAALGGCSADDSDPKLAPPLETPGSAPTAYDPELAPARAVLPLVPADATSLEVTDFDRVRLELGASELTGRSPAGERATFWQRAASDAPLLSEGLIRPEEQEFAATFGFTQDDVAWEARFVVEGEEGFVLRIRDEVPLDAVERAAAATTGPLAGAEVDTGNRLVLRGATDDVGSSWAAEPGLVVLVPDAPSQSVHVATDCLSTELATDPAGELAELESFSISFGSTLATARLGEGRTDVFDRARLEAGAAFGQVFTDTVADPATGRIGYGLTDPAQGADLTLRGELPFAVCA